MQILNCFNRNVLLFISVFLFFSCKKKIDTTLNLPVFNQIHSSYVSAYTTGLIPRSASIKVRFMNYVVPKEMVGKQDDNNYFSFEPAIRGKVKWEDRRTIEFIPESFMESGQVYNGELNLKKIFDTISIKETSLPFQFHTKEQTAHIVVNSLIPLIANKINFYHLDGTIVTSETESPENIEKILTSTSDYKIKWVHDVNGTKHQFAIDSIARKDKAYAFEIKWDSKKINSEATGNKIIEIPSLKDFKIIGSETHYEPEQFFQVAFSDPLINTQDLKGLITSSGTTFSFLIENNVVKAFPATKITGDFKLNIAKGIKNIAGNPLLKASKLNLVVNDIAPLVRLVGNGVIIPNTPVIPFTFEAINLNAVDVQIMKIYENNMMEFLQFNELSGASYLEYVGKVVLEKKISLNSNATMDLGKWNRHALDLSSLIKTEPGAVYRVSIKFRKDYSLYECPAKPAGAEESTADKTRSRSNNFWDYYYYTSDYSSENISNPCKDAYYYNQGVNRNILVSDLGMIAKQGSDGNNMFVISDLNSAEPIAGVPIDLFDQQNQKLETIETDKNGFAYAKIARFPYLAIAHKGQQKGYMKMSGSSLSLSKFSVDGSQYHQGIKGFIYADRGVWRPGDSIFVNLLLEDARRVLPLDHPVIFEMTNPRGQIVQKMMVKNSLNGFYTFHTATDLNAPTGTYNVVIKAGGSQFDKQLKVETIIPNRLKLSFEFDKKTIVANDKNIGQLKVKWLHGAPAAGMKTDITAVFRKAETVFQNFKDFIFDDPMYTNGVDSKVIFDGVTNDQGAVTLSNSIDIKSGVSGVLETDLYCKVFEPGGNFSTDNFSTTYYPYKKYVGIKLPKGDGDVGVLFTDQEHVFDIATLTQDGTPINETVEIKLYKLEWRYWYDYYEDDFGQYEGRYFRNCQDSATLKTSVGKSSWKVKIPKSEYGRYLVRVSYPDGHSTGKIIYFDYPGWYSRRTDNTAGTSFLTFSSNKEKYEVGETAILDIPSGFKGKALITLEKGSTVLKADWIEANKGKSSYSFTVTKDMAPNIYAYVTLLQPHAQSANELPMRLYGVVPIHVVNSLSVLKPIITLPEILKPESVASIQVKEANGKAMTYTIAMVDEGLLDLTKFKSPDPWSTFYAKEALQVTTWDIFDQVLGNQTSKIKKFLTIGGDGSDDESAPGEGTKIQRFKPMVRFLGPFYLEANKTASHTIKIPQYVGSVRTMVVAGHGDAYGSTEKTTAVKSPLMVLGTLPRVLGPGEEVILPVSVFAEAGMENVSLEVKLNGILTATGPLKQSLVFSKQGEQSINFPLKVGNELGIAKVQIVAIAGNERANFDVEVEVRAPNPKISESTESLIMSNTNVSIDYKTFGLKGTNQGSLEISSIPLLNLNERLSYLIEYPHGCIEQTTSSVFPQLTLSSLIKLSAEQKMQIDRNINAGIQRIRLFQGYDGGFSYWPGENGVSDWGTNYAGHFLIEAQKRGYNVPADLLQKWVDYQKGQANSNDYSSNNDHYKELTQAYRLYLLALSGNAEFGPMNRMKEDDNLTTTTKYQLAAAYGLAGQKKLALEMIKNLPVDIEPYRELAYTYGSDFRDEAMILEVLTLLHKKEAAMEVMVKLSKVLKSSVWLSTQESAYALLAMSKAGMDANSSTLNIEYRINNGKWIPFVSNVFVCQIPLDVKNTPEGKVEIRNKGMGTIFSNLTMRGIPASENEKETENNLTMEVSYIDKEGKTIDVSNLEQGKDFIAQIILTNPDKEVDLNEMALSYLFPSGWQVHNPRMTGEQFSFKTSLPEYMDVRDDRINYYFDLINKYGGDEEGSYSGEEDQSSDESEDSYNYRDRSNYSNTKTFRIALNASYLGKFYLPAVRCEAMYDKTISSTKSGRWVRVSKPAAKQL